MSRRGREQARRGSRRGAAMVDGAARRLSQRSPSMKREWYRIKAAADVAHLSIFDEIGRSFFNDDAVTARQFIAELEALPESVRTIVVHINSGGGDVFDAVAIANALRQQAQAKNRAVHTVVEGLAASAAS